MGENFCELIYYTKLFFLGIHGLGQSHGQFSVFWRLLLINFRGMSNGKTLLASFEKYVRTYVIHKTKVSQISTN